MQNIPKPVIRIDQKLRDQLQYIADKNRRSFSDMIRIILEDYVARGGVEPWQSIWASVRLDSLAATAGRRFEP